MATLVQGYQRRPAIHPLSLQASPSRGGAVGCSLVGGGVFVLLHGLPENRIDLFEMVDAFTEFALLAHQHSIASLQFLKA